ncbi:protein transport protein Sec24A isoform X4 [Anguilla anguilla]|uniref:protein transport protein Sec24A isoform X4 n=1 Tax=Anguilla anguilla TaxID=7936 RepID=UPI0015ADA939|nr:protein transport protein Sec24A isoform X4 [Anguilla anguilla]
MPALPDSTTPAPIRAPPPPSSYQAAPGPTPTSRSPAPIGPPQSMTPPPPAAHGHMTPPPPSTHAHMMTPPVPTTHAQMMTPPLPTTHAQMMTPPLPTTHAHMMTPPLPTTHAHMMTPPLPTTHAQMMTPSPPNVRGRLTPSPISPLATHPSPPPHITHGHMLTPTPPNIRGYMTPPAPSPLTVPPGSQNPLLSSWPQGPVGNHVTASPTPSSPGSSMAPPHFSYSASHPPGHLPSPLALNSYAPPGSAPSSMSPVPSQVYQPGRPPYAPPPAAGPPPTMRPTPPPTGAPGSATPPPPFPQQHEGAGQPPITGDVTAAPPAFDHLETGTHGKHMAGLPPPPQPGMNRPMGHSYPTLPPGYQNVSSPSSPAQTRKQPYSPAAQPYPQPPGGPAQLNPSMAGLSLQSHTPEALRVVNLLQDRSILPPGPVPPPMPCLPQDLQRVNCSPEVFRCTLTSIPQTQSLLNKAKLPLGLLLHPFKDLSQLPVVTSSTIVRCRSCRTYINPFVSFLDQRRWKCNLCYRVNDVPEEFMYNPVSRSYGEPHKRPEVQNPTIEFIAPSEYMLRPPQPAVYLFILDVSHNAVETGYLDVVCQSLLDNISALPGDSRTKIGFITFDSTVHFYNLQEGLSQPQMLIISDIDDIFLPTPDSLLVNLNECKELVQDLLKALPQMFVKTMETQSALGPALQAAFKLLSPTGGRVSVFQTQLPSLGVGALKSREDPNQRASAKDVPHLSPATDFYKKLALDCSGQQVAVDLFLLSGQYCDLASLGCISRYSAGSIYYYPSYHHQHNPAQVHCFQKDLKRYLTRKIGFEAVMRIRCTKGLSIHTFHGNFFVRSTDLLSLPNVNPDAGFAVQMSIEENLLDTQVVSFQAALLYTSSKGERRIRVHTMCLPVVNSLSDIFAGADVQAISGLLANMAVDRSVTASLSDARDAMTNAAIDSLSVFRSSVLTIQQPGLLAPRSLCLFPLYILALLKQKAFRTGTSTRLDDRVFAMCQLKFQPLSYLMLMIHPSLYRVDDLTDEGALNISERTVPQPRILQLSAERLSRDGAFLMDAGSVMYLWVGKNCNPNFLVQVLGVPNCAAVPQNMNQLPELDTAESIRTRAFLGWLREQRPFFPVLHVIRDESPLKASFMQLLVEDRTESALSYYEFLLHLQQQVSK